GTHAEDPWVLAVGAALDAAGAHVLWMRAGVDPLPDAQLHGVLSLLAVAEEREREHASVPRGLAATAALVRSLAAAGIQAPLWLATQGAVAVSAEDAPANPVQAQTWGLGLTVGLERPHCWGGLIDLPATLDEHVRAALAGVLAGALADAAEDQLALRDARVLARR